MHVQAESNDVMMSKNDDSESVGAQNVTDMNNASDAGGFEADKENFSTKHNESNAIKFFKCNECDYVARRKGNLKNHQHIHDRQKLIGVVQDPSNGLYKCTHCAQQFTKWNSLRSHLTKSHKNNQLVLNCVQCLRRFSQQNEKERHEIRCQARRYECYLCKKYVAKRISDMLNHVRTHSGAKPFKCSVCKRCFRYKYNLKRHLDSIHSRRST